jgi:hypothetical protein
VPRRRDGLALPTALLLLVVMTALAGGAFAMSRQSFRGGRNTLVEARAFAAAEYGLNRQISEWNPAFNLPASSGGATVGQSFVSNVWLPGGIDLDTVRITRLDPALFLVESRGRASVANPQLQATRTVAALVRLAYPSITPQGAITTNGNLIIQGNAFTVDGRDRVPGSTTTGAPAAGSYNGNGDAWDPNRCTELTTYAAVHAIAVPPLTLPSLNTNTIAPGSLGVLNTAIAGNPNTYIQFGTETMATLISGADKWYGPAALYADNVTPPDVDVSANEVRPDLRTDGSGTCNTGRLGNWGEPFGGTDDVVACQPYFPIIYVNGNANIQGNGRGQGILIVNGDLQINGNFDFVGLILVRDDFNKGNGTARITGAIMAGNRISDAFSTVGGSQTVNYSRCAVESALRGSAALIRVRERGWTQLF